MKTTFTEICVNTVVATVKMERSVIKTMGIVIRDVYLTISNLNVKFVTMVITTPTVLENVEIVLMENRVISLMEFASTVANQTSYSLFVKNVMMGFTTVTVATIVANV